MSTPSRLSQLSCISSQLGGEYLMLALGSSSLIAIWPTWMQLKSRERRNRPSGVGHLVRLTASAKFVEYIGGWCAADTICSALSALLLLLQAPCECIINHASIPIKWKFTLFITKWGHCRAFAMLRLGWNCIFEVAEITNTLGSTLRACVCTFTLNCKTTNLIAQKPNKTQHEGNCVGLAWLAGWLSGLRCFGARGSIVGLKWCQHNSNNSNYNNNNSNSNYNNKCRAALNMKS